MALTKHFILQYHDLFWMCMSDLKVLRHNFQLSHIHVLKIPCPCELSSVGRSGVQTPATTKKKDTLTA
jgi:hypothetical protein